MTSSIAHDLTERRVGRRRGPKPQPEYVELQSFSGSLAAAIRAAQLTVANNNLRFPSPKYQRDPVRFAHDVLGFEPWERQAEILLAVRDHLRVAVASGHKIGKHLSLDTPVPTPSGWTTIGAIRPGDVVFDERGQPCNVLGLSRIEVGRPCFEVEFDDGTVIVTDATHAWRTWTHRARKQCDRRGEPRIGPGEVVTTDQIRQTLTTEHAGRNHAVIVAAPIECAAADLPIDPYLLGVWLGDGTSASAQVTTPDPEIEHAFVSAGYVTRRVADKGKSWTFSIGPNFRTALAALGTLNNKHIPPIYLRGSIAQRRALLAGLLDSDGTCAPNGRVMFTSMREHIARGVFELAASLGFKPVIGARPAMLYGVNHGLSFQVGFTPHVPVFRLPRQLARQHVGKTKQQWTKQRMIVDVRRCKSVPVRCLTVDSPNHLFLVSHAFIPTHNSTAAAILALWFYCSFHDARAIMSSTTARQVDQILWRETRILRARGGRCVDCKRDDPEAIRIPKPCPHSAIIEGDMGDLARTGLRAPDFREVVGFTAREAEAVAGISGSNLLYILDEASGIPDVIFEAIEGNRAGGARVVMFGNPTRNEGEFFDAFYSKSRYYHCIRVSSEETPNVRARRVIVPGLATYEWIEEKKLEWGEDSPLYKIRIRGEHALNEEGRIFSVYMIEQAEIRWHTTPEAGCLFIGIDPAGESMGGDETVLCARRGLKQLRFQAHRGTSAETIVTHLVRMIVELRVPREKPVVVLDAEGPIGIKLARLLVAHLDEYPDSFELVRVYASNRAMRDPKAYERVRDELAANLEAWIRDGGAIIEDTKLEAELHTLEWIEQPNGRLKVTPKDIIRKQIDRSPDRYDALALSVWEPLSLRTAGAKVPRVAPGTPALANTSEALQARERAFDPYAATNPWRGDR